MHFQIVPSTKCNARCFYCYESNHSYKTMDDATIKQTSKFIVNMLKADSTSHSSRIEWFGGEPMLAKKQISEISSEIFMADIKTSLSVVMISNGSMISENEIPFLKSCHISLIQITLDGLNETYIERKNYYDSKITLYTIIKNIDLLLKNGIKVQIRLNIDKANISEINLLIDQLIEHFGSSVLIYVAPLYGEGVQFLTKQDVFEYVDAVTSKLKRYGVTPILSDRKVRRCRFAQKDNYLIKPNGDIIRCEYSMYNPSAVIGNVFDGIYNDEIDICSSCNNIQVCKHKCYDSSFNCKECWRGVYLQ